MRACWRDERPRHRGRFFSFDEIGAFPKPIRGDIPIWIGGHTPRALKRVVALGDGWHAAFPSLDALEHGIALLRQECAARRRRVEDLAITVRVGLSIRSAPLGPDRKAMQGSPEQIAGDLGRYQALGVGTVLLETRYRDLPDMIEIYEYFAREIQPRVWSMQLSRPGSLGSRGGLCVRCAYGSWGGRRPSMARYVKLTGTKVGATASRFR